MTYTYSMPLAAPEVLVQYHTFAISDIVSANCTYYSKEEFLFIIFTSLLRLFIVVCVYAVCTVSR